MGVGVGVSLAASFTILTLFYRSYNRNKHRARSSGSSSFFEYLFSSSTNNDGRERSGSLGNFGEDVIVTVETDPAYYDNQNSCPTLINSFSSLTYYTEGGQNKFVDVDISTSDSTSVTTISHDDNTVDMIGDCNDSEDGMVIDVDNCKVKVAKKRETKYLDDDDTVDIVNEAMKIINKPSNWKKGLTKPISKPIAKPIVKPVTSVKTRPPIIPVASNSFRHDVGHILTSMSYKLEKHIDSMFGGSGGDSLNYSGDSTTTDTTYDYTHDTRDDTTRDDTTNSGFTGRISHVDSHVFHQEEQAKSSNKQLFDSFTSRMSIMEKKGRKKESVGDAVYYWNNK